jgi:uncharacterized protein
MEHEPLDRHGHDTQRQERQERKERGEHHGHDEDAASSTEAHRRPHLATKYVVAVTAGALLIGGAGLGLALSDAGASTPAPTPAGCGSSSPHLTVEGTGQASAAPDVLTAVFGFSSTAGSSAAALGDDDTKVNLALQALAGDGVSQTDVQTTGLSLQAQYAYPQGGVPTLTGYQATNTITVTLRDTKTAGAAIDDVVSASGDAAQINSLSFSFSNPAQVEDQARAKAVRQAVAHAGAMAAAAGRGLGPVCSLTDNTEPPQYGQPQSFAANAAGTASPVPVEAGNQQETDQVTMVYALDQR